MEVLDVKPISSIAREAHTVARKLSFFQGAAS